MSAPFDIDADLPVAARTLVAVWRARVARSAAEPFLWFPGRGYQQLGDFDADVLAAAQGFRQVGIAKGDRVCLLMRNSPEMVRTMLALWDAGAVVVPLSPQLKGPLLRDQLARAEPAMLVADDELVPEVLRDADGVIGHDRLVVNRQGSGAGGPVPGTDLRCLLRSGSMPANAKVAFDDPALILFTSGSTGPSKGCVVSHHFCVYYGWVFWRYMRYRRDDTLHTCLPLNHVHALFASFWPSVLAGARFALSERFSASRYWQDIAESEATTCSAIGPMASILLGQPATEWEARIRVRLAHIAPAPARVDEFRRRFRLKVVSTLYGMTEAMVFPPDPDREPVTGVIGTAPADWDVAIVDGHGFPCGVEEAGELVVRPRRPHILFDGYFNRPDDTLRAWRGLWYHTGDICRRDASGLYWFAGRAKDVIRRRGHSVSTWEVETMVARHPGVSEVAAVGIPSSMDDENIAVVVMRSGGSDLHEGSLRRYCEAEMPRYMHPDVVLVLDEDLPKTDSGKIDKARVRARLLGTGGS